MLKQLADNKALFDEVKAVIKKQFEMKFDTNHDNEHLGQMVRARLDGLSLVEEGFREIAQHKSDNAPKEEENPAR